MLMRRGRRVGLLRRRYRKVNAGELRREELDI
jgi:hypothetical protein